MEVQKNKGQKLIEKTGNNKRMGISLISEMTALTEEEINALK